MSEPATRLAAPDHGAEIARPVPRRRLVLAACMMATFMAAVESTIVATAMPTIVAELGGLHLLSWVFAAYSLTLAASIPVYGRLADVYGRKRVFFAGAGLFLFGSTLCGFASAMPSLILFRALQGLGAGAVQPIAFTIVGDIYTPAERARVQGALSAVFGVAAIIGPALGAFLVAQVAWSTVFWVNLPIGAAAIAMIGAFLHEPAHWRRSRVDLLGAALLMLGVGGLMLALVQGTSLDGSILAAAVLVGLGALAALVLQQRVSPAPILPFALWRNRVIVIGGVGSFTVGAIMMGISAFLPTYVQGVMGESAASAGFALAAMSVSWTLASIIAGRMMVRTSYRLTAVAGTLALIAGTVVLAAMRPTDGPIWAGAGAFLIGLGMGSCNTTFIVSVQATARLQERGSATASNMFLRMIGQAIGAAVFGAVLNLGLARHAPEFGDAVNRLLEPAFRHSLAPADLARVATVIADALRQDYMIAAALAVVALGLALWLPRGVGPARRETRNRDAPGHLNSPG